MLFGTSHGLSCVFGRALMLGLIKSLKRHQLVTPFDRIQVKSTKERAFPPVYTLEKVPWKKEAVVKARRAKCKEVKCLARERDREGGQLGLPDEASIGLVNELTAPSSSKANLGLEGSVAASFKFWLQLPAEMLSELSLVDLECTPTSMNSSKVQEPDFPFRFWISPIVWSAPWTPNFPKSSITTSFAGWLQKTENEKIKSLCCSFHMFNLYIDSRTEN